jgi:outer membrane receptor for ferrienterochelin and colicin
MVLCSLAGAFIAGGSISVAAADKQDLTALPLESLLDMQVYSASKFPQKVSEAPAAVTIITSADIKDYGYRTLADILRSIRGLYITTDRNYSYLGVGGVGRPRDYNTRVTLLVDGYRANENKYD